MLVGQLSPGPDFLLIAKNALNHDMRAALSTVAGISTGICVHAILAASGLAVLLAVSTNAFRVILVAGALYLAYLGVRLLLSLREERQLAEGDATPKSGAAAFREGLLTNLLNPKVVVFFSSMLAQFVTPDSPPIDRIIFPAIIIVEGVIVWCLFARLLQTPAIKSAFLRYQKPVNAVFGILLLGVAASAFLRV